MSYPTKENPKIKWVKKASQWCSTYFEEDKKGNLIQRQDWSSEKPSA